MNRFLTIVTFLCSLQLGAQSFQVSGRLASSADSSTLAGAHVALLHPWGESYKVTATDDNGSFLFEGVSRGGYVLTATYLGFQALEKEVTITENSLSLGVLVLEEGDVLLDEVEVREQLPLATQEGDTTSYNADAFKTLPDANAEDLVGKMPGVNLENGRVTAQGENVQEVLVDGRRFFGNDPTAALRTLPAEVISKIQIFDQQSEQAQFSGVEDGETIKTINIITKPNMRNGQFGKVYAGYGTEGRYQAGGNTSFFDGARRISIIGQSNNVNQQNFSSEDLVGVTGSGGRRRGFRGRGGGIGDFLVDQQGGISQTHAVGINYSDEWGKKIEVTGSYFFNYSDNIAEEQTSRQFVNQETGGELYDESYQSETKNTNHRANLRLEYNLSERTSFIFRPRLSFQTNDGNSMTDGQTALLGELLNESISSYNSNLSGVDFRNDLLFRHRLPKEGRTFSIRFRNTYSNNDGESFLDSRNGFYRNEIRLDTLDQFSDILTRGWSYSAEVEYTEPLSETMSLSFEYEAEWETDNSDRETLDKDPDSGEYENLNEPLSNVFENDYITHRAGVGIRYRKGRDLFGMVRARVQSATLRSEQVFPNQVSVNRNFFNVVPFAMLRYNISKQKNLRIFYRSNTSSPSVSQLQNVINNSNPLQLRAGNPELDQSFSHRLFIRYSSSDIEKANTFFILLSGSLTSNYVGNATYLSSTDHPIFEEYEIERGAQLTIPVNLDGYRNLRLFTTYGMPMKGLKTNMNIELSANYSRTPGLIDNVENYANNTGLSAGLSFTSNISERVDFTIGTNGGYNVVRNTLRENLNDNYWTLNSRGKIGVIFPAGFVLRSDVTHRMYRGLAEEFNTDYFLWNIAIGKKIFKNQLGEISVSVFDLLKQNQSIQRNVTETYIEDQRTNVLQQYFMVNFTYNFRNFGSGPSNDSPDGDSRRPGGPPHWHD